MQADTQFKNLVQSIAEEWPQYLALRTRDKHHPTDKKVVNEFPQILERWVGSKEAMAFNIKTSTIFYEGSAGQGNISKAPWIAAFDERNTSSAQFGLYPVFLFPAGLDYFYLNIGIGTTQFTQAYGENKTAKEKIKQSVALVRSIFRDSPLKPPNIIEAQLDLKSSANDKRLSNYEIGSIFSFPAYNTKDVDVLEVKNDFLSLLQFYQAIIEDPLLPSAEELILRDMPKQKTTTHFKKFSPGSFDKKSSAGFEPGNSKEIGDIGEAFVMKCEREKLINAGRKDLVDKIIPHFKNLDFCGWDITSYDEDGNEIFIEVKSTSGPNFFGFIMSPNEWAKAHDPQLAGQYKIYRVLKVLSKEPEVHVVDDINDLLANDILEANPTGYKIEKA